MKERKLVSPIKNLPEIKKGVFLFKPPVDISLVGSYATDTVLESSSTIDIALTIPKVTLIVKSF